MALGRRGWRQRHRQAVAARSERRRNESGSSQPLQNPSPARTAGWPERGMERTRRPSRLLLLRDRVVAGAALGTAGRGPLALSCLALALWAVSLPGVNVRRMTDLGLISVLSPGIFVALVLLTVSFAIALHHQRLRPALLGLQLGVLILMLYGITALVEEAPRFAIAYKHAGFAEYIMRTGHLDTNIDAYFSWPGSLVLLAFVTQIAGLSSALDLAAWASVFFNVLWAGPLYMIMTAATDNKRLAWLGLWFFFLTNWIGQDYLSPQALTYFFYLLIVAVLLTWFQSRPAVRPPGSLVGWQRAALIASVLVIFAAVVSGHPLTPFFTIAAVGVLVVVRRIRPRALPVVMVAMTAAWILVVARPFVTSHLSLVTGSVGQVDSIVSSNLTLRVRGSPEHVVVIAMRIAMTFALWGTAALGAIHRFRAGHRDLTFGILALAPLALIPLQAYGGEMILRAYLFSLPAIAFFAASCFFGSTRRAVDWRSAGLVAGASLLLLGAFLVTRYGNERIDYITNAELAGVRQLYQIAPPGSILVSVGYVPWKLQQVEAYHYRVVPADALSHSDVKAVLAVMRGSPHQHAYFLFTRSEDAQVNLFYGEVVPSSSTGAGLGSLDRLVDAMIASGQFAIAYRNADVMILTPVGNGN